MKNIVVILIILSINSKLNGQDVLNPYIDYSQFSYYPDVPLYNSNSLFSFSHYTLNNANYTGEYEINISARNNDWYQRSNLLKTYKIETVSYPFSMLCAFTPPNGCLGANPRIMTMPVDNFDETNRAWGDLTCEMLNFGIFDNAQVSPAPTHQTLVSYGFYNVPSAVNHVLLPHTILKHTVNLHCGPNTTDPIISSFSWYYDNTRGRMRYYPFANSSVINMGPNTYDIIFFPEFVFYDGYYSITNLNDIENYDVPNQFSFSDIPNPTNCNLAATSYPPFNSAQFGFGVNGYVYPSDQVLISAPARTWRGQFLAGFDYDDYGNSNTDQVSNLDGVKQNYFIDKGYPQLKLNWINPSEKLIFNPSEVTVKSLSSTPIDLRFPTLYTFKTILGVYPSVQEATQANTTANGGPYAELRDVPVPVNAKDLIPAGGSPNDYPEVSWDDLTTTIDDRYGYYYIDNLGQITVEPCVKIFDAKFEVRQGGTLLFEDYTQTKNPDRFSITGLGGAIAKNFLNIQYLQNSIITQPQHIPYIAVNEIYAGTNVDPSPNTTSPYVLESGSDVEFVAGQNIYLKDGFSAKAGSKFHAHISASSQPTCPSGWRIAENSNNSKKETNHFIGISPNPAKSNVTIECKTISNGNLFVYDITGREMLNQHFDLKTDLELSKFTPGMFVVRIQDDHGVSVQGKMIVQK